MTFLKDDKAQIGGGAVLALVSISIGILILAIVFTIAPVVGYNVENSVTIPTTSEWNSNSNPGILNGSELWEQDTPLLGSAAIVVVAAVIIGVLLGSFMLQSRP